MRVRLRLPELLDEHEMTAYELAQKAGGRIVQATLYRLVKQQGRVRLIDGALVETIMDVLGVPLTAVLETGGGTPPRKLPTKRRRATT